MKSFSIVKRDIPSWFLSSSVARRNGQGKGSEARYFQKTLLYLGMAARGAGPTGCCGLPAVEAAQ